MSIRYTLRHNIPAEQVRAEDVNDSSTWDLNLIRKHELAETNEHDIVYRQHDGKIVSWSEAATQRAQTILEQIQEESSLVDQHFQEVQTEFSEIERNVTNLTDEAERANTQAQEAIIQAESAVTLSQQNASNAQTSSILSREWAVKENGKVNNEDYSSKHYAKLAEDIVNNAFQSCDLLGSSSTMGSQIQLSLGDYKWIIFQVECTLSGNNICSNAICFPSQYLISQCSSVNRRFSVGSDLEENSIDFSFKFHNSTGVTDWTAHIIYPTGTVASDPTFKVFGIK